MEDVVDSVLRVTLAKPEHETVPGALQVVRRLTEAPLADIRAALEGSSPMEMGEGCVEMLEMLGYRIVEHC